MSSDGYQIRTWTQASRGRAAGHQRMGDFIAQVNEDEIMKWTQVNVPTSTRIQLLDITPLVTAEVEKSGVNCGVCHVYMPHTTAGLTINENADPDVARDILAPLARLVPATGNYRHSEGNSDAHIKASLMGFSVMVPVTDGHLALGTW